MKKLIFTIITWPLFLAAQTITYRADVFNLNTKNEKPDFTFELTENKVAQTYEIKGQFKKAEKIQITEEATIDSATADIIEYKIDQKQTGETGHVTVVGNKIKIVFKQKDKTDKSTEIDKPERLVAPANFDRWMQKNFELIKQKKSLVFNFLVWDKLDTFSFKIKYLGQESLNGKPAHHFKMNTDSLILSAFFDPIEIWYNLDMSEIQQYKGRVAVKLGERPDLKNLDAVVKYFH